MMAPLTPAQTLCLAAVALAAIIDLRTRKIPNALTAPAAVLGIAVQYWTGGCVGVTSAIAGWFTGAAVTLVVKQFARQFGYGDVKLIAAVGTFVGPKAVLVVWLYFSLCFGLYSLLRIFFAIPWRQVIPFAAAFLKGLPLPPLDLAQLNTVRRSAIPLAPFIAAGTLCAVLLDKPTLHLLGIS